MARRLAPLFALLFALCVFGEESKTHTITIDGSAFTPAKLTVKEGDTVVWVNKDFFAHTATSDAAGVFDSGDIETGKSWKWVASKKGEFPYTCLIHPSMEGTLTVE